MTRFSTYSMKIKGLCKNYVHCERVLNTERSFTLLRLEASSEPDKNLTCWIVVCYIKSKKKKNISKSNSSERGSRITFCCMMLKAEIKCSPRFSTTHTGAVSGQFSSGMGWKKSVHHMHQSKNNKTYMWPNFKLKKKKSWRNIGQSLTFYQKDLFCCLLT